MSDEARGAQTTRYDAIRAHIDAALRLYRARHLALSGVTQSHIREARRQLDAINEGEA